MGSVQPVAAALRTAIVRNVALARKGVARMGWPCRVVRTAPGRTRSAPGQRTQAQAAGTRRAAMLATMASGNATTDAFPWTVLAAAHAIPVDETVAADAVSPTPKTRAARTTNVAAVCVSAALTTVAQTARTIRPDLGAREMAHVSKTVLGLDCRPCVRTESVNEIGPKRVHFGVARVDDVERLVRRALWNRKGPAFHVAHLPSVVVGGTGATAGFSA
jgi:hypothetical protein